MIDKVLPNILDTSKDARLRDKRSMYVAHNVQVDEDLLSDSNGNSGVLKPKSGNTAITSGFQFPATANHQRRVIGSVSDERLNVIYFFVYSTNANEHGVYAYDEDNALSEGGTGEMKKIFTSSLFNFPQNGFVKGDVVHSSSFKKGVIYFTDNVNEPRRLDVYRALVDGDNYTTGGNDTFHTNDFITACPKTPLHPITFYFDQDPNRSTTEFEGVEGFQFAYQCVYKSGEETALSTYSDIAVPPAYVHQGTLQSATLLQNNRCVLTIPRIQDGVNVWSSKEIEKIRIVGRIGNTGAFYLIDEVDVDASQTSITYNFYNDKVISAIPTEDQQKQFDSLPRKARAQAVVNNRLFYGNYVEGYDNVDENGDKVIPSASFSVVPVQRPTDFINLSIEATPVVLAKGVDYNSNGIDASALATTPNRRVGYKFDMSDLPDIINSGSVFTVSMKVAPDKNFHIYNSAGGSSHHLSKTLFGRTDNPILDESNGHLTVEKLFFGENDGVADSELLVKDPGTNDAGVVSYVGTSASNPLIIKSGVLSFSCAFSFTQDITSNGAELIKDCIVAIFTGANPPSYIEVLNSSTTSSFNYNLFLDDVDEIPVSSGSDYRKNLICAAKGDDGFASSYFIINNASVEFGLEHNEGPSNIEGEEGNLFFNLKVNSLDISDVRTCVPVVLSDGDYDLQAIEKWQVYGANYLTSNDVLGNNLFNQNAFFIEEDPDPINNIDFQSLESRLSLANSIIENINGFSLGNLYSIVDGESHHRNYSFSDYAIDSGGDGDPVITPFGSSVDQGSINFNNVFCRSVNTNALINTFDGLVYNGTPILYQTTTGWNVTNGYINPSSIINTPSEIEIISFNGYLSESVLGDGLRSFKTNANHQFGVVYYDERGRSGPVMPLGSVYVPGYSDAERGPNKGRVEIFVELLNNPPYWAHSYQIVYAGNSNVSDFFQYTAGGAFVAQGEEQDANIYVSLNYLQNNTTASYVHGFGAVNNEGGNDLYVFKKGDKLRVISYYRDENIREFPQNIEFDIVDSVVLGSSIDDNPLYIDGEDGATSNSAPKAKTGQFLVLKNNSSAVGFSHYDISQNSIVNSQSHFWNNRCVIEVYTPSKKESKESMAYYEISECFNVVRNTSNQLVHQTNAVRVANGDVWWKRSAVNMPNYNESINGFDNIILGPSSEGVFRDYFVESKAFTNSIPRCEVNGFGKLKLEDKRSKEIRRDSSITYSDQNNYASSLVRFTSFNASKLPYKDLPNEHGKITSILNYSDSIFCIQEDKCSAIPVSRDIISDAIGNESLITTSEVLGSQKFYAGSYGCEDHPESVTIAGNNIYFVSVANKEVYRFNPSNGVYPVSETGMKSYFRRALSQPLNRVIGGYDPVNDEFLISWNLWPSLFLIGGGITNYSQETSNQFFDEFEDIGGDTVIIDGGNPGDGVDTGGGGSGGGGTPDSGYDEGFSDGFTDGYDDGFDDGYDDGSDDATGNILDNLEEAFGDIFDEDTDTIEEIIYDIQEEIDNSYDEGYDTGVEITTSNILDNLEEEFGNDVFDPNDVNTIQEAIDAIRDKIDNDASDISDYQDQISSLQEQLDNSYTTEDIQGYQDQIDRLNKRVLELEAEVESKNIIIEGLKSQLQQAQNDRDYYFGLWTDSQNSLALLQVDYAELQEEYELYQARVESELQAAAAQSGYIVENVAIDMTSILIDAVLNIRDKDGRPILTESDFPQPLNQFLKSYADNGLTDGLIQLYLDEAPFATPEFVSIIRDSINRVITDLADQIQDLINGGAVDGSGDGSVNGDGGGADNGTDGGTDDGGPTPEEVFRGIPLAFDPSAQLTPQEIRDAMFNVLVYSASALGGAAGGVAGGEDTVGRYIGAGESAREVFKDENGVSYFTDQEGVRYNISGPTFFEFAADVDANGAIGSYDLIAFLTAYGSSYELSDQPTITRAD